MGSIYVKHYSNKIVIENPGSFPEGINEKNIITHPSIPRNKLISETLQRLKYVQRTGQGVDIIFREMVLMGKPYPKYNVFNDAVSLTIESTIEDSSFVKFIVKEQEEQQKILSLAELMIIRYVIENKRINMTEAQVLTQNTNDNLRKCFLNLIKMGLLENIGKEYALTARVYDNVKSDVEYIQDKVVKYIKAKNMILEYLEKNKYITNDKIQELCNYTRDQSRRTTEKMRREDLIEIKGRGRGAKYYLKE